MVSETFKLWEVTFNTDGGGAIAVQKVRDGEKIKSSNPAKDGYTFDYWSCGNNEFNVDTPITNSITLKANWVIGSIISSKDVAGFTPVSNEKYVFASDITQEDFDAIANKVKNTGRAYDLSPDFSRCNNVTSIRSGTFKDCDNIKSVIIPDSVTSIGNYVFRVCTKLESVNIPNNVTSIWVGAFADCISLTSVNIPGSVRSIESDAFAYCKSLTSIIIQKLKRQRSFLFCLNIKGE